MHTPAGTTRTASFAGRHLVRLVVAWMIGATLGLTPVPAGTLDGIAALRSGRQARSRLVEMADSVVVDLIRRGRLAARADVVLLPLPRSFASADFDFASNRCVLLLDPDRVGHRDPAWRSELALRFALLHELSHCELFARPGVFGSSTGGDGIAAAMLDDLLLFETIDAPEDRPYLNLFALAHEAYADVRAIALLREEGVAAEALAFVADIRDASPFDQNHSTGAAIRAMLALRAEAVRGDALEAAIRGVVAGFLVREHLRRTFSPDEDLARSVWQVLRSHRLSVLGRARAGEAIDTAPHLGNAGHHPAGLDGYPSIRWFFRNAETGADNDEARADRWLGDSYGLGAGASASLIRAVASFRWMLDPDRRLGLEIGVRPPSTTRGVGTK